ncbi:multicopper oxidase family protein [Alkalilacustris brevis]|uniref:multicopper oxidase family protein n=1 Tax=Alkalilacustris brevis TaxID=2026338 RepID=UPI000E0D09E9|nr:multicopper oxidase domain-containing protein [Alkalilacustris brevis]
MTRSFSRRRFLATTTAGLAATSLPRWVMAEGQPRSLVAGTRTLEINGRAATAFGLENAAGGQGLILEPGERFRVALTNRLEEDTIIHWHGQIPPNAQDGVPDAPMPALTPGETRNYDFEPLPGTFWMHSHFPVQEMQLLAAPLIVRSRADVAADRQEVVMILQDFSFTSPEELMENIEHAHGDGGHGGMNHGDMGHGDMGRGAADHGNGAMGNMMDRMMGGMGHGDGDHGTMPGMGGMQGMGQMPGMQGMEMDLNDIDFDAYLANDRTLADPEVMRVERGGRVKLRIINAAAATVFWIDTGTLEGRLVAVDGHDIEPLTGRRFGFAMGQRLDIELDLPAGEGAWPILALREGERERTGLILATSGARVERIADLGNDAAPAFDYDLAQELRLRALAPLPARQATRQENAMLGGTMSPYVWTINGRTWGEHTPLHATSGERVEITFHNMSMMAHPMHLHGHVFQVVGIGGRNIGPPRRINGAARDTVHIPPMSMVTIALDAGEAARWMLHCHHMPHLITGMMTELVVAS